jgi:hypothetical protein
MSDTTSAYPPPPPPNVAPPVYHGPAGQPLPNYMPPPVAQPPAGYPVGQHQPRQQQQAPATWQQPGLGLAGAGILSQFSGPAAWACFAGLVTIAVPFVFGRVFFFLPIIGVITGVRAVMAGKLLGGIVGIVLSAIGGLITIVALTQPG